MRCGRFRFRPDPRERVKEHETVGVRADAVKRFQALWEGDRLVSCVPRAPLGDGHGEVTSAPFREDTLLFENQLHEHRARVRFDREDARQPVGDVPWVRSSLQGRPNTAPTNRILIRGAFRETSEAEDRALADGRDGSTETPCGPPAG